MNNEIAKELFKELFGDEAFKMVESKPFKCLPCHSEDISGNILATNPSMKQRFTEEWLKQFQDDGLIVLDLFIHMIYDSGITDGVNKNNEIIDLLKSALESVKNKEPKS